MTDEEVVQAIESMFSGEKSWWVARWCAREKGITGAVSCLAKQGYSMVRG
ncbi:MAG: hypothetical protein R3B47_01430 [Bacteroidia bacterium]